MGSWIHRWRDFRGYPRRPGLDHDGPQRQTWDRTRGDLAPRQLCAQPWEEEIKLKSAKNPSQIRNFENSDWTQSNLQFRISDLRCRICPISKFPPAGMDSIDLTLLRETLVAMLREDVGSGDITSRVAIPAAACASARYVNKQPLVVAGIDVVQEILSLADKDLQFKPLASDGASAPAGTTLAEVRGSA